MTTVDVEVVLWGGCGERELVFFELDVECGPDAAEQFGQFVDLVPGEGRGWFGSSKTM
jgi:hypothetical protein